MTELLIGALGIVIAAIVAFLKGRDVERKSEEARKNENYRTTRQALDDTFRELDGLSDDDIDRRLRDHSRWKP